MEVFLKKNKYLLTFGLLIWQLFFLPIISFAAKLEYELLESKAFGTEITKTASLGKFLSQAFNYGIAIAGVLAVVMIVWGGVEIMLSESVFSKDEGKKKIKNALIGLFLALFSWLILYIINPEILNFKL